MACEQLEMCPSCNSLNVYAKTFKRLQNDCSNTEAINSRPTLLELYSVTARISTGEKGLNDTQGVCRADDLMGEERSFVPLMKFGVESNDAMRHHTRTLFESALTTHASMS